MLYSRYIKDKNGTLTDLTREIFDYDNGTATINLEVTTDYLYIGQILPFNHLYFKVGVVNDQTATLSLDYWDGTSWRAMVDVIDETSSSGVTLAKSGHISWVPSKNYVWHYDDTTTSGGVEQITGLGDVTIYDMYWVRIKTSANLKAETTLTWAGNLFSTDTDLFFCLPLESFCISACGS